jgi:pullulanase/glycogen debranching enzyme
MVQALNQSGLRMVMDVAYNHTNSSGQNDRSVLDKLVPGYYHRLNADGVNGSEIILYGEAWNFGEVANDARFEQARQANMAGTGIGSFNDRIRDGVRGGGAFSGLPVASKNRDNWPMMAPLLANPALRVTSDEIKTVAEHFREMLMIRKSSRLFRLPNQSEVIARVGFLNTGPSQVPGLIVMTLADPDGSVDRVREMIVVLFNATNVPQLFATPSFTGFDFKLHEVQQASSDPVVRASSWDGATATFSVPARTTSVFVARRE